MRSKKEEKFKIAGFGASFFQRFWKLQYLLYPGLWSLPVGLFVLLLLFALLEEFIIYAVGLIPSQFYKVLGDKDWPGFQQRTVISLAIIICIAVVKSVKGYVAKILNLTWRQLLTKATHRLYYSKIRYYQLNVLGDYIDNPDQRIADDINKLCQVYSTVATKVVVSPFTISYYTYQAYSSTGWVGPTSIFIFFVIGTFINKLLMSPIVQWVIRQERREGDFRFKHMQIRSNAESLAFLTGARLEELKSNEKLDALLLTQRRLYGRQVLLGLAVNLFDYTGSIVSYLALAVPIFSGRYDNLTPGELSALISQNAFVCIYLISTFSSLVDLSATVSDLAGVTHRVSELLERLQQLDSDEPTSSSPKENGAEATGEFGYNLKEASLKAPHSASDLVRGLNLSIQPGQSILITGSSSAGKTSLLRALRGLWPLGKGTLNVSGVSGPQSVLFLPQKPYMTDGSLREQIVYPLSVQMDFIHGDETDLILGYLHMAHLGSLIDRTGGIDTTVDWNWYDVLSPGEMQRLSFVRLLYHRPSLAFLDEATSALDLEMEQRLYKAAIDAGITLISVGHRLSLKSFHQWQLNISGNGTWTLEQISNQQ